MPVSSDAEVSIIIIIIIITARILLRHPQYEIGYIENATISLFERANLPSQRLTRDCATSVKKIRGFSMTSPGSSDLRRKASRDQCFFQKLNCLQVPFPTTFFFERANIQDPCPHRKISETLIELTSLYHCEESRDVTKNGQRERRQVSISRQCANHLQSVHPDNKPHHQANNLHHTPTKHHKSLQSKCTSPPSPSSLSYPSQWASKQSTSATSKIPHSAFPPTYHRPFLFKPTRFPSVPAHTL